MVTPFFNRIIDQLILKDCPDKKIVVLGDILSKESNERDKYCISIKDFFENSLKFTNDKDLKNESFPWYIKILGVVLSPLVYILGGTAASIFSTKLKRLICQAFESGGKIDLNTYLISVSQGLNEGIIGLNEIGKEFSEIYEKKLF